MQREREKERERGGEKEAVVSAGLLLLPLEKPKPTIWFLRKHLLDTVSSKGLS
jgi:hypothetical protein